MLGDTERYINAFYKEDGLHENILQIMQSNHLILVCEAAWVIANSITACGPAGL